MDATTTVTLRSRNEMPILGFGTWQLTENPTDAITYAIGLGYMMIDTSSDYGTQPQVGEAVGRSDVNRDDLFIVTKIEETEDSYQATKDRLSDLSMEYVDLMLIHRPPSIGAGEGLWEGLIEAKREGLARDIGVSNYSADQMQTLIDASGEVPVVNQVEWSPFGYSPDLLDYASDNGIILQAYSPLTRGKRLDDSRLETIATKHGKSPAQILIRWNLQLGVVPVVKANNKDHQEENINVFDFDLTDEDIRALNDLNEGYSALS